MSQPAEKCPPIKEEVEYEESEDCFYCGRSPRRGEVFVNVATGIRHCGECDEEGDINPG